MHRILASGAFRAGRRSEVIFDFDRHAGFAGFDGGKAGLDGLCALNGSGVNGLVIDNAVNKFIQLTCGVVIVDDHGIFNRNRVRLRQIRKQRFAVADAILEHGHVIAGIVGDDRALRTVEYAAHRIIALAAGGDEHLADDIVWEFHNSDRAVVGRIIGQHLVVRVGENLRRVAGNPACQIDRMAASAKEPMTQRVKTPRQINF